MIFEIPCGLAAGYLIDDIFSSLRGTYLSRANLQHADLRNSEVIEAVFIAADLTDANFTGAYIARKETDWIIKIGMKYDDNLKDVFERRTEL